MKNPLSNRCAAWYARNEVGGAQDVIHNSITVNIAGRLHLKTGQLTLYWIT